MSRTSLFQTQESTDEKTLTLRRVGSMDMGFLSVVSVIIRSYHLTSVIAGGTGFISVGLLKEGSSGVLMAVLRMLISLLVAGRELVSSLLKTCSLIKGPFRILGGLPL